MISHRKKIEGKLLREREMIDFCWVHRKLQERFEKENLKEQLQLPTKMEDFTNAISKISSSVSKEMLDKYDKWMKDFGSV